MGNNQPDDAELWSRSLLGEVDAFGLLFDRHRDRIFRHAYRLSPGRHDAEDVLATAFLELWRRRDKVRLVDGSVLPWLLVTTTNVARRPQNPGCTVPVGGWRRQPATRSLRPLGP